MAKVKTNCDWCGKEITKVPSRLREKNFCSNKHRGKYRRGKPFHSEETKRRIGELSLGRPNPKLAEISSAQTGENHPRWAGDEATEHTGRHRAQRLYDLQPCEVCGMEPSGHKVHRHHRDGDTLNNSPNNIAFLCAKHHKGAHAKMKEDK